jgi:hypothetical protein
MTLRRIAPPTEPVEVDDSYEPYHRDDGSTVIAHRGLDTGNLYEVMTSPNGTIRWYQLVHNNQGKE